jgi:ATP synthase protein I
MAEPPRDADPDDDMRRIEALEARVKAATKPEAEADSNQVSQRQTNVAYRVLVDIIAGLLVGGFLGYWLDRWWGTAPYLLVTMIFLGFVGGANNAWRAIKAYAAEAEKDQQSGR